MNPIAQMFDDIMALLKLIRAEQLRQKRMLARIARMLEVDMRDFEDQFK